MNKEEIEELKDFTIDITDIDELALGLEVCSKKSNMVIQEFANLIIELEQQNQKYKEVIDRAIEYVENNPLYEEKYDYDYEENSYLSGINDEIAKKDLLEILKEVK